MFLPPVMDIQNKRIKIKYNKKTIYTKQYMLVSIFVFSEEYKIGLPIFIDRFSSDPIKNKDCESSLNHFSFFLLFTQ